MQGIQHTTKRSLFSRLLIIEAIMNFLFIVVTVVLVLLIIYITKNRCNNENFNLLGELAPYQKQLYVCLDECNRSKPTDHLANQGNMNCSMYCYSMIGEMARKGIPPDRMPPMRTSESECKRKCDLPGYSHRARQQCIDSCFGETEVAKYCKEQLCPYTDKNHRVCMRDCILNNSVNNVSNSFTWQTHN